MKTLSGALLFVAACGLAWGQATAQMHGTVSDSSGAAVPGANITAIQTGTGVTRAVSSGADGGYVLTSLPLGPYRIEVSKPGFSEYLQSGIVLDVNSDPAIAVVLQVGSQSEQVTVEANGTQVETRSAGVSQIMENQQILELPLNGRNVTDLIALSGAATVASGAVSSSSRDPFVTSLSGAPGVAPISIAGGANFGLSYVLDGANHNSPQDNLSLSVPFPDALQEFKVETSAMSAQYGTHSAGAVNLVTKAGTNEFHGDLFEFVRNGDFNARNFFALTRDTMKRNQFGGTLGGPIKKDKLFFFVAYQGTLLRQTPLETPGFVPTQKMLAGDFTAFASAQCQGRNITLKAPFVNNQINPALFSPAALKLAALLPPATNACGLIEYGNPVHLNDHMVIGKTDYQFSPKHSLFVRYLADSLYSEDPYDLDHNLFSASVNGGAGLNQATTIGDTYLLGPNAVNSLRLTFNRSSTVKTIGNIGSFPELGVNMFSYVPNDFKVSITGGLPTPVSRGPTFNDVFALAEDVNLVIGSHQLVLGGQAAKNVSNAFSYYWAAGIANFNGQITGLGMADFLTGNVFQWTDAPPDTHTGYQWNLGIFAQDTWKVRRNLTVNYGLRWEPFFPEVFTDGTTNHFDLNALAQGIHTTIYNNAPPGISYPGDPGYPGHSMMNTRWNNFSPRVGLAWDPKGDGKMSIRASFGVFYDFVAQGFQFGTNVSPPFDPNITLNNVKLDNPWATYAGGNPFPYVLGPNAPFPAYSNYAVLNWDTHNPTVTEWNLSIQRQIGTRWLVSANYVGNETAHLWTVRALNPSVYIPGNCTAGQYGLTAAGPCSSTANSHQRDVLNLEFPGQQFGYVNEVDDGGTASYEGLILTIQRRFSRGISITGNYTWSHCISDPFQAILNGGSGNGTYTNPNNREADRGNCTTQAQDIRQMFNLSAVLETPRFSGRTLRAVASGWRVSPILQIQSGASLTVITSSDIALDGIGSQRVNQISTSVFGSGNQYLNPAAFALPATGTMGNLGMGSIVGPGYWGLNVALSRSFQIRERNTLELRAEAFNLTNSFRALAPTTNFNSNIFGQITAAQDPRIMQFAVKYVF